MASEQRVLIAFDDVVNALKKEYGKVMNTHIYSPREILESIGNIRRVDAVEVVHARWVRYEHGSGIYCSHCRHKRRYRDVKDNYCPNCGAKMDGGDEDG